MVNCFPQNPDFRKRRTAVAQITLSPEPDAQVGCVEQGVTIATA